MWRTSNQYEEASIEEEYKINEINLFPISKYGYFHYRLNSDDKVVLLIMQTTLFLADFVFSCKRSDPQVEKCVLDSIEEMRPRLKDGIPEFNVPVLDPFTVPRLKLNRTAPNLRVKATIKQTKAFGGSDFKIEKLR